MDHSGRGAVLDKPSWRLSCARAIRFISRPDYLYGMLRAADVAKYFGKQCVTVIEFGVASGAGLLNMADLAPVVEKETGIGLRIVGFDTGVASQPPGLQGPSGDLGSR